MEGYFFFLLTIACAFFSGYNFGKGAGINLAIRRFNEVFGPYELGIEPEFWTESQVAQNRSELPKIYAG